MSLIVWNALSLAKTKSRFPHSCNPSIRHFKLGVKSSFLFVIIRPLAIILQLLFRYASILLFYGTVLHVVYCNLTLIRFKLITFFMFWQTYSSNEVITTSPLSASFWIVFIDIYSIFYILELHILITVALSFVDWTMWMSFLLSLSWGSIYRVRNFSMLMLNTCVMFLFWRFSYKSSKL